MASSYDGKIIPVLGLRGDAGWGAFGDGEGLGSVLAGVSSSARMLSSRASTPATACERKDPHLEACFSGAAIVAIDPQIESYSEVSVAKLDHREIGGLTSTACDIEAIGQYVQAEESERQCREVS
jgi:hypothetical protein